MLNSYTTWKLDSEYGDNNFDLPHTGIPVARSKWSVSITEKEPLGIEVMRKPACFPRTSWKACALKRELAKDSPHAFQENPRKHAASKSRFWHEKEGRVAPAERPTWTQERQATSSL